MIKNNNNKLSQCQGPQNKPEEEGDIFPLSCQIALSVSLFCCGPTDGYWYNERCLSFSTSPRSKSNTAVASFYQLFIAIHILTNVLYIV